MEACPILCQQCEKEAGTPNKMFDCSGISEKPTFDRGLEDLTGVVEATSPS
jgi:hypothetical protein